MDPKQRRQIKKYLNLVVRRKWLLIACILLGASAGLSAYLVQPKIYASNSLLSYQQQKVNPAKMSPDIEAQIRDIVSTLSQIVTSRTSLEKIIEEVGLYKEARQTLPMEDVVERMRKNIVITPSKQGDTFNITFSGNSPNQVARVTNMIAAQFIEENLKYREERASETSAYTEDELEMAKNMLDRKEAVMRDYKLKYYNEMPEQRSANMSRLIALQEQYQNRQESIQDLERTRVLIQDQISARKQLVEENTKLKAELKAEKKVVPEEEEDDVDKLVRLKTELVYLQERYTEEHPAIKRIRRLIAHLETTLPQDSLDKAASQVPAEKVVTEPEAGVDTEGGEQRFDEVVASYQIQIRDIGRNIEELNQEKEDLLELIKQYEQWVAATPVREAEWAALTREYGELKRHYDFLVSQNLQARSALNLERKQKGSQFKIEDPARVPVKPVKPDFMKILGIALLVGTAAGGALALGLEFLDTSFRDPEELEEFSGIDVICLVPQMELSSEKRHRLLFTVLGTLFFGLWAAGVVLAFLYFWKQGRIIF